MSQTLITDRFTRFCDLIKNEPLITTAEFALTCSSGGISRCTTTYSGDGLIGQNITAPKDFEDRSGELAGVFDEMMVNIVAVRFSGIATIRAKSFLGKVYKIRTGYDQDYRKK